MALAANNFTMSMIVKHALGQWLTIPELKEHMAVESQSTFQETGLAAAMRALRKHGFLVDKSYRGQGVWEYRVRTPNMIEEGNPELPPYELGRNIVPGDVA